jgi:hypothetical protein
MPEHVSSLSRLRGGFRADGHAFSKSRKSPQLASDVKLGMVAGRGVVGGAGGGVDRIAL